MKIFMRIIGKRVIGRTSVVISFSYYHNISLLHEFDCKDEADKFFNSVNLDSRMPMKLMKTKLCRHKNLNSSKTDLTGYYEYCPKCKKATYHYSETLEEQDMRLGRLRKRMLRHEIEEHEFEMEEKKKELSQLKKELDSLKSEAIT